MEFVKCPECGKEYSSFASACPVCGCPNDGNSQQSSTTEKVCPDCGESIDPSAESCPHCGCPNDGNSQRKSSTEKKCPDCGKPVDQSAKLCPYCGCPLDETSSENNNSNSEQEGNVHEAWENIKDEFTSAHNDLSNKKKEPNTKFVKESLLPEEKILCAAKWHWINYIVPVLMILCAILIFIESFFDIEDRWPGFFLAILLGALGYLGFLEMKKYEFVVTTRRIFIKQGIILRLSYELRLEKLESIQVFQGIIGRLLNFGIVLVHGVGASRGIAGMLVAPMEFRQHIFAELSKQNDFKEE